MFCPKLAQMVFGLGCTEITKQMFDIYYDLWEIPFLSTHWHTVISGEHLTRWLWTENAMWGNLRSQDKSTHYCSLSLQNNCRLSAYHRSREMVFGQAQIHCSVWTLSFGFWGKDLRPHLCGHMILIQITHWFFLDQALLFFHWTLYQH